jgi:hypothetical protein
MNRTGKFYRGGDGGPRNYWIGNVSDGMKRSAETRRCPKCGRGASLKSSRVPGLPTVIFCRWKDCGYEKVVS